MSGFKIPDSFEALRHASFELAEVGVGTESSCPVPYRMMLDYLQWEAPGIELRGDAILEKDEETSGLDLHFHRTFDLDDTQYWMWLFDDLNGIPSFCLIAVGGKPGMHYDETFGLTPEQIVIGTHFNLID
ncbi:MAG: hypothetical protein AAFY08_14185 [Planctomycetota bacterium]